MGHHAGVGLAHFHAQDKAKSSIVVLHTTCCLNSSIAEALIQGADNWPGKNGSSQHRFEWKYSYEIDESYQA